MSRSDIPVDKVRSAVCVAFQLYIGAICLQNWTGWDVCWVPGCHNEKKDVGYLKSSLPRVKEESVFSCPSSFSKKHIRSCPSLHQIDRTDRADTKTLGESMTSHARETGKHEWCIGIGICIIGVYRIYLKIKGLRGIGTLKKRAAGRYTWAQITSYY